MDPLAWLILFVALSSGTTWLLLRHGVPRLAVLHRLEHPDAPAMVSSWLALAIAMPSIVLGSLLGGTGAAGAAGGAGGAEGAAAGLPAAAGLVGLGAAMIAGSRAAAGTAAPRVGTATIAAAGGAALLAVVLVVERHLTVWTGQAAFAVLAVLLWMGGPPRRAAGESAPALSAATRREELRAGIALILASLLAIGEGLALRGVFQAADAARQAAGVAAGTGRGVLPSVVESAALTVLAVRMMLLAAVAGMLPGALGRRAAAWTMAMGLLGAVGIAAFVRLPSLLGTALRGEALPGTIIAGGFGAWAGPAVAAAAITAGLLLAPRGTSGRLLGAACVAAGALAAAGAL